MHLYNEAKTKDSKGNKISIGDCVKVLCSFDNKIYKGNVFRITKDAVEIDIFTRKISIKDYTKITKIPDTKKH